MAETFKNAKLALTTSLTTVYTCPASTTAIIIGSQIANIDGSSSADATVEWTDSSDSDNAVDLVKAIPVPADTSFSPISGKLVLEEGDTIKGQASANGDLEMTLSILEIT